MEQTNRGVEIDLILENIMIDRTEDRDPLKNEVQHDQAFIRFAHFEKNSSGNKMTAIRLLANDWTVITGNNVTNDYSTKDSYTYIG